MKLLKKTVWLLATVSLVACGSDDDSGPSFELSTESIVGSYEVVDYKLDSQTTGTVGTTVVTTTREEEFVSEQTSELLLLADGTFTTSGFITNKVTQDGVVIDDGLIVNISNSGRYDLDIENELITFDSETSLIFTGEYDIEFINEVEMRIDRNTNNVDEDSGDTTTENTEITFDRR